MYPETTPLTPLTGLKTASVHQKQPPARIAFSVSDMIASAYGMGIASSRFGTS